MKIKLLKLMFSMIILASCVTLQQKEEGVSLNPMREIFNPKSTDSSYNRETININYNVSKIAVIKNWTMEIMNTENERVFYSPNYGNIKETFVWDGKNDSMAFAPDGNYYATLTINYELGEPVVVVSKGFTIDTKPLAVKVKLSTDIFSPGKTGRRDNVIFFHEDPTKKADWTGTIYNSAGNKVETFFWKDDIPTQVVWDGRDVDNKILPDGKYYYQVTASDLAGNYFESEKFDRNKLEQFKNVVEIFTKDIPVSVTASRDSFNPKSNDPAFNTESFDLRTNIPKGTEIMNWKFEIKNVNDVSIYSVDAAGALKNTISWNGTINGRDFAIDGMYYALLTVNFNSIASSSGRSRVFSVDTFAPLIEITPAAAVFSPNSDGILDSFDLSQKGSMETLWTEKITSTDDKIIWGKSYSGYPAAKESWNGLDSNGKLQKNGTYIYTIESTDPAGNYAKAEAKVELKNEYTSAYLNIDKNQFSSDNAALKISPSVSYNGDIDNYKLEILDNSKAVIRTFQGTRSVPGMLEWHGLTDNKLSAPDGEYTARLSISYRFGNKVQAESPVFILHNQMPDVNVSITPDLFSPDNDGINDKLFIDISAKDITGIKDWSLSILNPDKNGDFITFGGKGEPAGKIEWDGMSKNGELVESAEDYPVIVKVSNNVGTIYEKELESVHVDILVNKLPDGRYKIRISSILFKPDTAIMIDTPKNTSIIKMLAGKLMKFPDYNITLDGYVNPFLGKIHYVEEIGQRLSEDRGNVVAKALDLNGISISRIKVIGIGGKDPIVFPDDKGNINVNYLEKNRRVEFYLDRK